MSLKTEPAAFLRRMSNRSSFSAVRRPTLDFCREAGSALGAERTILLLLDKSREATEYPIGVCWCIMCPLLHEQGTFSKGAVFETVGVLLLSESAALLN